MSPKLAYAERYDWRLGVEPAKGRPRAYQPRSGGPPLLFATDVRMTILVTLALAKVPLRCTELWRHIGRKNFGCVRGLTKRGLIARWRSARATYVALEPAHPAHDSLARLLVKIAALYRFTAPTAQAMLFGVPQVPARTSIPDIRYTFGDKTRTLPLLMVYIRQQANVDQIARCIPRSDTCTVRHALLMFKAFGVLKSERVSRGLAYWLNPYHALSEEIRAVLRDLDVAMPQWRVVAEHDVASPRSRSRENRAGRRKPKRWRW